MTESLTIPAHASGRIDIFAVDLPPEAVDRFMARGDGTDDPTAAWPLRAALGADFLDPRGIELVSVADLAGLGLAGYLREGLGAEDAEVTQQLATLDALDGLVLILRGPAYGGVAQTLRPRAPLTHIATLHEEQPAPPGPALHADSAEPAPAEAPEPEPEEEAPKGSGTPLPIIAGGLIAAAVLVLAASLWLGR